MGRASVGEEAAERFSGGDNISDESSGKTIILAVKIMFEGVINDEGVITYIVPVNSRPVMLNIGVASKEADSALWRERNTSSQP